MRKILILFIGYLLLFVFPSVCVCQDSSNRKIYPDTRKPIGTFYKPIGPVDFIMSNLIAENRDSVEKMYGTKTTKLFLQEDSVKLHYAHLLADYIHEYYPKWYKKKGFKVYLNTWVNCWDDPTYYTFVYGLREGSGVEQAADEYIEKHKNYDPDHLQKIKYGKGFPWGLYINLQCKFDEQGVLKLLEYGIEHYKELDKIKDKVVAQDVLFKTNYELFNKLYPTEDDYLDTYLSQEQIQAILKAPTPKKITEFLENRKKK